MFAIRITLQEKELLVKLLNIKVKEIHAWRIATKSQVRDAEYDRIATLCRRIALVKEN